MVRYITMKRITQILASVLFVITVLTVYLAFDFAINNAVLQKATSHKRSVHEHDHNQIHEEIKITKKRSLTSPIVPRIRKSNHTIKHTEDHNLKIERPSRIVKPPLHAKPGGFHKGKTGVKVNKSPKSIKEQRKRLLTTTIHSHHKDKHHVVDHRHPV